MTEQGMLKLIFSDSFDPAADTGARLMTANSKLVKQASTIFGCDYSALKPDKDHVGIHLVALGDAEHFGANRNFDFFPKKACVEYHGTFVRNGHVYQGHNNKDPEKARGIIKASAYNEDMGRIELFIHAHKEKAAEDLERMDKEGSIPVSMACRVARDRCSVCGTFRKSAADPNQCDHIKNHFGELRDDGIKVGTYNDEPNFFDISFVRRPADRIAWDLKKVASTGVVSSVDLAKEHGLILPSGFINMSESGLAKMAICKSLAELEVFSRSLEKKASLLPSERFMQELKKAACCKLTDDQITTLRDYEPRAVFTKLAEKGIVLDPESFFKYAFGCDYGSLKDKMQDIIYTTRNNLFDNLVKKGQYRLVCNNSYFDVDTNSHLGYITDNVKLGNYISNNLVEPMSFSHESIGRRVIANTINGVKVAMAPCGDREIEPDVKAAADIYAAYKLSALTAIVDSGAVDKDLLLKVAAVQGTV